MVTGKDLLDQLMPMKDRIERLVLPSVMLKANSNVFLDGITLEEIRDELDTNIEVIENHYSVLELIDIIKYSTNN